MSERTDKLIGNLRSTRAWQQAVVWLGERLHLPLRRNFLILSSARCGTMIFTHYLNRHRKISCAGEILGQNGICYGDPWSLTPERLRLHVRSYFVKRPGVLAGAKILTYHLDELPIKMADLVELLHRPKVLVLYRESLLDQYVSLKLAERGGLWHAWKPVAAEEPIHLDPASYLRYADRERRMWRQSLAALDGCDVHYLTYEALTNCAQETMRGVFEFLGLQSCAVKSRLVRLHPGPLLSKLSNYQEFVQQGIVDGTLMRLSLPNDPPCSDAA